MRVIVSLHIMLFTALQSYAIADESQNNLNELQEQFSKLTEQVEKANIRIGELEQKLSDKKEVRVVIAGDIRNSIKLPDSDTSVAAGGYIKMDILVNSISAGTDKKGNQSLYIPDIPVGTNRIGKEEQISMHAKSSRFWFRTFTPSKFGDVNTLIEFDMFASSTTYAPRLRHAFGSIGNFLAGQTWTTFTNSSVIPEHLDSGTPVGDIILRQSQLRWTKPIVGNSLDLMMALEMPLSKITKEGESGIITSSSEPYPDIVLRLNGNYDWANLSLATMCRKISISDAAGLNEQKWGGAIGISGKINTFELDNLRFMFNYGNALARYVTSGAYADAALNLTGEMDLITLSSGMLSYQHFWSDTLRSTASLSYSNADLPNYVSNELTKEAHSIHVNLLWNLLPKVMVGMEYIYANRKLQDGQEGDLKRLQLATRFNF